MFTEGTLEEIRSRTDIVELIGEYVQLKKTGQGYQGLCPFHNEKSPSFHVHPVRQIFRCFGCDKGGNVFGFVQAIEGLNFPEAVRRLGKRCGVEIVEDKEYRSKRVEALSPASQRTLEALDWAAKYFNHLLMNNPEYAFAREYLTSRGISQKTIEAFRIGVSPKGWNTLMGLMMKRNYSFTELVESGLVIQKEGAANDGYDRFRERLMFPITDKEGNTIAFGARTLNPEEKVKYINSSESSVFSKKKTLYGLFENQRGIRLRGEVIIVEGYMDVVGLYEAGVNNAVAVMGTALTEEHCQILRSFTQRVVTVFDPDSAGAEAWHRSVHLFMDAKLFAKDLTLPEQIDPDEYVSKEGAATFYELCDKAPEQFTKYLKEIANKGALSEQEISKHLEDMMPILVASRKLPNRATLWDNISLLLKVSVPTLRDLAETAANKTSIREPAKPVVTPKSNNPNSAFFTTRRAPQGKPKARFHPVDLQFFQAAVSHPDAFVHWPQEAWQGAIHDKKLEEILISLRATQGGEEFDKLLESLAQSSEDAELASLATSGLFRGEKGAEDVPEFMPLAESVRKRKKEIEIQALSMQVKLTQRLGDDKEQLRLLEKLRQLRTS